MALVVSFPHIDLLLVKLNHSDIQKQVERIKIAKRALKLAGLIWVIQFHWIIFKTTWIYYAGAG